MGYYVSQTGELKFIDDAVYTEWVAAGNPKADAYTRIPDPPSPNAQWNGTEWVIPPAYVPDVSDRQFFQQAAAAGLITQAEALLAVKVGDIPNALQTIVDGINDPDEKFSANMLLSGATVFLRHHPMTEAIGAAYGWTAEQIDSFFIAASVL